MSLKNDIEMVRQELNSEEKFFEKAVITEKFVKKYKSTLIGTIVVIIIAVSANIAYELNKTSQIKAANETLILLMKNPTDATSSARLESLSPALYDAWIYSQAVANKDIAALEALQTSKTFIVSDMAKYEVAQNSKDISKLDAYASIQNAVYGDLAVVQSAVILINEGKSEVAHQKLTTIKEDSSMYTVAKALLHYGVK